MKRAPVQKGVEVEEDEAGGTSTSRRIRPAGFIISENNPENNSARDSSVRNRMHKNIKPPMFD
jgi:hypothetical protein